MKITGISEETGQIRIEVAGCNMRCPYCVHIKQPSEELSVERLLEYAAMSSTEDVYIAGAEPTLQKDLIPLIEGLHKTGKRIILKSNGMKPDVLKIALPFVYGFVIEIKAASDDISGIMELTGMSENRSKKYVSLLTDSLSIANNKWLRIWIRVIPEYVNSDTVQRILPDLEFASEVMLYQFMSNPDFDIPFMGHDSPSPSVEEIEELAEIVLSKVAKVRIVGEGRKHLLQRR